MMRSGFIVLIVCWSVSPAAAQPEWKVKTDPPAPKTVAAVEAKIADLAVPASFFAADVTFADQFGPFVATGRNGAPQESRAVYDLRSGEKVAELKGKHAGERPSALAPSGMILAAGGGPFNAQTI